MAILATPVSTVRLTIGLVVFSLIGATSSPSGLPPVAAQELPRWIAGCWAGNRGDERFHERWSVADARTLLGMGYTLARDRVTSFEYFRIVFKDGRAVYIAQPGGAPPTEFVASSLTETDFVFENPAHDFPKRVSYRRVDANSLTAWVDGGSPADRRLEFPMTRVTCEP